MVGLIGSGLQREKGAIVFFKQSKKLSDNQTLLEETSHTLIGEECLKT